MAEEMMYADEKSIRQRVERRFKERQDLRIHFAAFVTANIMLWIFWLLITPSAVITTTGTNVIRESTTAFPWPLIITACWGIGIVSHFLNYYYKYGAGAQKREEAIEREIERIAVFEKPKNDQQVRLELTDDGEIQEVYDNASQTGKQKRR